MVEPVEFVPFPEGSPHLLGRVDKVATPFQLIAAMALPIIAREPTLAKATKEDLARKILNWLDNPVFPSEEKIAEVEKILGLTGLIHSPVHAPLSYLIWFESETGHLAETPHLLPHFTSYREVTSATLAAIDTLGLASTGLALLAKKHILDQSEKGWKMMKTNTPADLSLDAWEKWNADQRKTLRDEAKEFGINLVDLTSDNAVRLLYLFATLSEPALTALGALSMGAPIGAHGWRWHRARKHIQQEKEWIQQFQGLPFLQAKAIQARLAERERSSTERKEQFQALFQQAVAERNFAKDPRPVSEILAELKEGGIDLALVIKEPIVNKKLLSKAIESIRTSPEKQKRLADKFSDVAETKAVLTRNALQTLAHHKTAQEMRQTLLTKRRAQVMVAGYALSALAFTLLKIFAVTTAMAITGFTGLGLLALSLALILIGLGYLYHTKPQVFRAYIRGTYLLRLTKQIPRDFHGWRYQRTLHKIILNMEKGFWTTPLERRLRFREIKKFEKHKEKFKKWAEKCKPIEQKIQDAEWNDLVHSHPVYQAFNPIELIATSMSNKEAGSALQRETYRFYCKIFGGNEKETPSEESIRTQLRRFAALDETEIVKYIQAQQKEEE